PGLPADEMAQDILWLQHAFGNQAVQQRALSHSPLSPTRPAGATTLDPVPADPTAEVAPEAAPTPTEPTTASPGTTPEEAPTLPPTEPTTAPPGTTPEEAPTLPPTAPTTAPTTPDKTRAPRLIVDDTAGELGAGQMRRSAFLTE